MMKKAYQSFDNRIYIVIPSSVKGEWPKPKETSLELETGVWNYFHQGSLILFNFFVE